jgi:hypothetical protein
MRSGSARAALTGPAVIQTAAAMPMIKCLISILPPPFSPFMQTTRIGVPDYSSRIPWAITSAGVTFTFSIPSSDHTSIAFCIVW